MAIKVLAESTPRDLFVREVEIWSKLRHVNVLRLLGASSASGDPPWFFVSPYERNGSLVEYLKKIEAGGGSGGGGGGGGLGLGLGLGIGAGVSAVSVPTRGRTASFPAW